MTSDVAPFLPLSTSPSEGSGEHGWRRSPGWSVEIDAGTLTARAGADEAYVLTDLSEAATAEVARHWSGTAEQYALSSAARQALDQLVLLGALKPAPAPAGATLRVAVAFAGLEQPVLRRALVEALGDAEGMQPSDLDGAGLVVLVRTTATLAEAGSAGADCSVPHLFVDVAYHHTVSLGPLVVPGDTACLGCLAGRVTQRWGDPAPPPDPAATHLAQLVAGLVSVELERVAAGRSELANRTIAFDLDRWRLLDETVLRLPWCQHCGEAEERRP